MATQKSNNPAIVAMQEMMQRRIEQEPEFALKMANPNKSMEGAINFLCNEVKWKRRVRLTPSGTRD